MPRCPYCDSEVSINDFFAEKEFPIIGKTAVFSSSKIHIGYKNYVKMWVCPHCDRILGFSENKWDDD